jgi:predicted metal-dependent peptidase
MPETSVLYQHRATRAIQRMVEFAPSTGGLALWVRHQDVPADIDAPPAMTDGNTVYYGVAFDDLQLPEQVGLVAHEVLHVALCHPQRFLDLQRLLGDVDLQLFNICADAIVNSTLGHLSWLRLPPSSVFLDQLLASALDLKEDVETALLRWDVERLYRAIDDRRMPDQSTQKQSGNNSQSNAKSSSGQSKDRNPSQAATEQRHVRTREDGKRSAKVRALGAQSHADLAPSEGTQGRPRLKPSRPARGASASCVATSTTAPSPCCAP